MSLYHKIFVFFLLFIKVSCLIANVGVVPASPKINAKSFIMMDYVSGKFLVDEKSDERVSPASITKIMTIYVVAKELDEGTVKLDDKVLISKKAWQMPGSRMFIEVDKQVSVEDLLKGVIVQSGNDASVALAEHISGSEEVFVQLMNQYAKQLGMNNSNFENSTGLPSEQHYSTAKDLALLARALIHDFPEIYQLHSMKEFVFNDITQPNRNQLLWRDPSVDGLKTGHTDAAGYCLVASALRDGMRLITVVMGTESTEARTKATQALLNYGYRFFETRKLYSDDETVTTVKVWKGDVDQLSLGIEKELIITIPRGQYDNLKATIETREKITAPIMKGDELGTIIINLHGDEYIRVPLVALNAINKGSLFNRLKDNIKLLLE